MKKEIKKSPFFAKLLEKQVRDTEKNIGGKKEKTNVYFDNPDEITYKYPSDEDEGY